MKNQIGICRSREESLKMMVELVTEKPMTTVEIAERMGVTKSAVHRYITNYDVVKVVNWRYIGRSLVAVFGIAKQSLTREQWFKINDIPTTKTARKAAYARKDGAPWAKLQEIAPPITDSETIKRKIMTYGIPQEVKKRFDNGASFVMYEGKKYAKEELLA